MREPRVVESGAFVQFEDGALLGGQAQDCRADALREFVGARVVERVVAGGVVFAPRRCVFVAAAARERAAQVPRAVHGGAHEPAARIRWRCGKAPPREQRFLHRVVGEVVAAEHLASCGVRTREVRSCGGEMRNGRRQRRLERWGHRTARRPRVRVANDRTRLCRAGSGHAVRRRSATDPACVAGGARLGGAHTRSWARTSFAGPGGGAPIVSWWTSRIGGGGGAPGVDSSISHARQAVAARSSAGASTVRSSLRCAGDGAWWWPQLQTTGADPFAAARCACVCSAGSSRRTASASRHTSTVAVSARRRVRGRVATGARR